METFAPPKYLYKSTTNREAPSLSRGFLCLLTVALSLYGSRELDSPYLYLSPKMGLRCFSADHFKIDAGEILVCKPNGKTYIANVVRGCKPRNLVNPARHQATLCQCQFCGVQSRGFQYKRKRLPAGRGRDVQLWRCIRQIYRHTCAIRCD